MKKTASIIGAALAGFLAGAASVVAVERRPNLLKETGKGTREMLGSFVDAFKEGYRRGASENKRLASGRSDSREVSGRST